MALSQELQAIAEIVEEQFLIPPGKGIKHMSVTFEGGLGPDGIGEPVEGVRVEVYNDQGVLVMTEITNSEGAVSLPLEPGWYRAVGTKGDFYGEMYFEVVEQEHIWNEMVLQRVDGDGNGCECTDEILEVKHQIEDILADMTIFLNQMSIDEKHQTVILTDILNKIEIADFSQIKQLIQDIKACACPRPDFDLTEIKQMIQNLTDCACPGLPGEWCSDFEAAGSPCFAQMQWRTGVGLKSIKVEWRGHELRKGKELLDSVDHEVVRYFNTHWSDFVIEYPNAKEVIATARDAMVLIYADQTQDGKIVHERVNARKVRTVPGVQEDTPDGRIWVHTGFPIFDMLEVFNEMIYRIVLRANQQKISTGMMVKLLTDLDGFIDEYSYGHHSDPILQWTVISEEEQVDRGDLIATPLAVMQRILRVHVDIPPITIPPDERIGDIIIKLEHLEDLIETPKIVTVVERVPWYVWLGIIVASVAGGSGLVYGAYKRRRDGR